VYVNIIGGENSKKAPVGPFLAVFSPLNSNVVVEPGTADF